MAEIDSSSQGGHGKHKGKVRGKKMSTRVDLTPMVDLAFLLISFFMLTTSLSKPVAMQLTMPKKDDTKKDNTEVKESKVINIILDKNDVIWYYNGLHVAGLKKTNYSASGIREVLYKKQAKVKQQFGLDKEGGSTMICLIKMASTANYKNMVDILDEMDITSTKIYAIQDLSPIEKEAIANDGVVKSFASE